MRLQRDGSRNPKPPPGGRAHPALRAARSPGSGASLSSKVGAPLGGTGGEGGLVTSRGAGIKLPGHGPSRDTAQGAHRAAGLGRSPRAGRPSLRPSPGGDARRHHAPERGPPGPCALGLQALGGHRLQPAFGHHQGRCFLFFCCKSGALAWGGSAWSGEWPVSPGALGASWGPERRQQPGKVRFGGGTAAHRGDRVSATGRPASSGAPATLQEQDFSGRGES